MGGCHRALLDDARYELNPLQFVLRVHDELIGQMRIAAALRIDKEILPRLYDGVLHRMPPECT